MTRNRNARSRAWRQGERATRSKPALNLKSTAHGKRTSTRPHAPRSGFSSPALQRFAGVPTGILAGLEEAWHPEADRRAA